jgi:hypothetical protein
MNRKPSRKQVVTLILLTLCLAVVVVFSVPNLVFSSDKTVDALLKETCPRLAVTVFLIFLLASYDREVLLPSAKNLGKDILWCLPCFAVAVVNFPFSALISGGATVTRTDLIWLFAVKCLSIGAMEELFFRGLLVPLLQKKYENRRYTLLYSILISAAIFSLMHLVNLFFGASVGATALQLVYTFLLGCMFAAMFLKTKNIWLSVAAHTVFDFGGGIVTDLGSGAFQDTVFWVLTIVFGVVCGAYILYYVKKELSKKSVI